MRHTGHLGVLLGDALPGVDHDDAHVRPVNGHLGAHDGEFLNPVVHLGLAADAGRIQPGVHRVPGGAGHIADNHPLLAQHPVHKRRLAHVGLADDGHTDGAVVRLFPGFRREGSHAGVQKVPGTVAVYGGNGNGIAQTQRIKLVNIGVQRAGGIHFIYDQHNGLLRPQQHIRNFLIRGGDAGGNVAHKHDHVRRIDGNLRLLAHEQQNLVVRRGLNAAGIHQIKAASVPVRAAVDPVAGHTGRVLHDGQALPDQAVEQHGFAHIGPSYNGDKRF